ncbi:transposase [Kitasatospora sp. NPDC007106]|uniref:transposase n=1 Tax=Kitasatospora sp. NPDC007106 TaxID=3156914 RepID=UPI0033E6B065
MAEFRMQPLGAGPYTFVRPDASTRKVREGGRVVDVHCLVAVGVNAGVGREVLCADVFSAEGCTDRLAFLRGPTGRELQGRPAVPRIQLGGVVVAPAAACRRAINRSAAYHIVSH